MRQKSNLTVKDGGRVLVENASGQYLLNGRRALAKTFPLSLDNGKFTILNSRVPGGLY